MKFLWTGNYYNFRVLSDCFEYYSGSNKAEISDWLDKSESMEEGIEEK